MNCVVAVVSVHVVDFAVEDEPAPGNPLRDAPRYRPEVEVIVLAQQSNRDAENDLEWVRDRRNNTPSRCHFLQAS